MDLGNLGQNLVKGFANAAGAPEVAQSIDKKQDEQRKNQMQMQVAPLSQALQADQVRLALYADPKDPTKALPEHQAEYDATMARMENTIGQMRSVLGQPAPHKNLADRLHIGRDLSSRTQQYQNQSKQMAGEYAAGALPYEVTLEGQKEKVAHKNAMELAEARTHSKWANWKMPDGTIFPFDEMSGATPPPGAVKIGTVPAVVKAGHVSDFQEFLKGEYGDTPTPEQRLKAHQQWTNAGAETVGTHTIEVPQSDGSIKMYQVTTTSRKGTASADSGGQDSKPTGPKTAQLKANASGASTPKGPKDLGTVGGKQQADVTAAKKGYEEAVGLASMADEVAKNPKDAINQKRLAVQLERLSAGRFTTQALSYVIKAGWGNTIQQWLNNPSTGALPPNVMRQLVDGAHQYLNEKKATLDAAQNMSGGGAAKSTASAWKPPKDAPQAPKNDGYKLKAGDKVIAISRGGQWVEP